MSFKRYIVKAAWEWALLFVCCWCTSVIVMDGFFVEEQLQFGPLPALVTAAMLACLYVTAWRRSLLIPGVVGTVALSVVVVGFAMAVSTSETPYADEYGNWLWAAVVVIVVSVAGFLLARAVPGAALWFAVCMVTCTFAEILFRNGRLPLVLAVLISGLALVVYRNSRVEGGLHGGIGDVRAALTSFAVACVPVVGLVGISYALWFLVIAPLNPGYLEPELIVEYRKHYVEPIRGVGNVTMRDDTTLTTDQLVEGEPYTTDDLKVDPNAEVVIEAQSQQIQDLVKSGVGSESGGVNTEGAAGGSRDTIDRESLEQEYDAISYTLQIPWGIVASVAVLVFLLAIIAYFIGRRLLRTRRLVRLLENGAPREQVQELYLFLLSKLRFLGFAIPPGASLSVFSRGAEHRMESIRSETKVSFEDLTSVYERVVYGGYEPVEDDVVPFVAYYEGFWKAARKQLGNVPYFFKSFRLG